MKNCKIQTILNSPEGPNALPNKTSFILIFEENCLYYEALHDFQYGLEPVLIQRILIGFKAGNFYYNKLSLMLESKAYLILTFVLTNTACL